MFTSTALLPATWKRALSTISNASKRQSSPNSHHCANVYFYGYFRCRSHCRPMLQTTRAWLPSLSGHCVCKLPIAGMRTVMSTPRGKCSANVDLASPADALRDSSRVPPPRASAETSHTFFPVCYVAVIWESRAGRIGTNQRCVEILNLFPRWGMHLHSRQSNCE